MTSVQTHDSTQVRHDLDFDMAGKQFGHLFIPRSTNTSAWGELWIPIATVSGRPGKTVLLLGGTHGDEYESQIVLLRLLEEFLPADVTGRLIVIPCISGDGSEQGTRLWPDGTNFNRVFPGDPRGSVPAQLADFFARVLFPMADVIADLHSGGRSLLFPPISTVHLHDDDELFVAMVDAAVTWLTDFCMIHVNAGFTGLLPNEAERQGKLVITTELGGAGIATRQTLVPSERGLLNLLRALGVLKGAVQTRADLGLEPVRFVTAAGPRNYIRAGEAGLFEPMVEPGQQVREGEIIGRMRFPRAAARPSEAVMSPVDGFVCALRAMPASDVGDCLAVIGEETSLGRA